MKNVTLMSQREKYDYIFSFSTPEHPNPITRFDWLEKVLFSDIQTFVDGIYSYISQKDELRDPTRGGGNLALPILICSALELTSALHAGNTMAKNGKNGYTATKNVEQFVSKYFPGFYSQFPSIFWDGIRNGITHTSFPKFFKYDGEIITFTLFVEDPKAQSVIYERDTQGLGIEGFSIKESFEKLGIEKPDKIIQITINSLNLVKILKESIQRYRSELQTSEDLQNKFIEAFSSIEDNIEDINSKSKINEAKTIIDKLTREKRIFLD